MTQDNLTNGKRAVNLTDKERNLIDAIRRIKHGRVEIIMVNSAPDRIEKVTEGIKL